MGRNIIVFIFLLLCLAGNAQNKNLPFSIKENKTMEQYLEISLGTVLDSPGDAFKANVSVNNILFHRFGAYGSIETSSGSLYNIYGITASLNSWAYLFGGIDGFTKHGIINNNIADTRKEAGIGFIFGKLIVTRFGYSSSVGPTLSAGIKLNLK